ADGSTSVFRQPSGRANGLEFDREGRLIACEGNSSDGGRRVSRTERDGSVVSLVSSYNGHRLNSPNDLHIDPKGRNYFTDPPHAARKGVEQDKEAVYRIDPDGKVTRVLEDVQRPNGILVSADGRTLFVADNHSDQGGNRTLVAYAIGAKGELTNKRVLAD